jgi:hypothetical protein
MVAVPVQSELILYVPVSAAKSDVVAEPPITTKTFCVNFPFPSKSVIATPFWGTAMPGPGSSWPEMDWPYLPFSEALEHAAACELDAATSARHAIAAAIVPLLIVPLQIPLLIRHRTLGVNKSYWPHKPGPGSTEAQLLLKQLPGIVAQNPPADHALRSNSHWPQQRVAGSRDRCEFRRRRSGPGR